MGKHLTKEEREFLFEINDKSNKEAIQMFFEKFGRYLTNNNINNFRNINNLTRRNVRFTQEQKDFLLRLFPYKTEDEISDLFYKKYNRRLTKKSLKTFKCKNNKNKKSYSKTNLQDNQLKWLLNMLPYHNNLEAIEIFKNKFDIELSNNFLKNTRHKYHIEKQYKQKINDMRYREKIRKPLYNIINSYRSDTGYCYDYVRVDTRKYQLKRRYVWEQYYGKKIPRGYVVIFLDGNKKNYDINNLALVKKGTLSYSVTKGIELNDKDIIKTVDMLKKLDKKIKSMKEA
ncbi:MAG: HNH endonuclease [Bacilli bacterium]|nr:HNH endonuclease [Bacilli bacterium]